MKVVTSSEAGLAISSAMSLTGMLQFGIRTSVDLENKMTSVERVIEYSQTPSEAPLESKEGFSLNFKSFLPFD